MEEAPSGGKVPLVELKNVGKSYGNITALKDISLRVHAGEVTGILGDNGAGKSTLIKIISGLHQQTDGELLVDGEPTKFNSPKEALGRGIATVYQNLAVVPLMPVWRNFFLARRSARSPSRSRWTPTRCGPPRCRSCTRWASTCPTSTWRSVHCRVVSASAWRSRGRCSSGRGC